MKLLRELSKSWMIYALTIINIVSSVKNQHCDFLLWLSVALCLLSILLTAIKVRREANG